MGLTHEEALQAPERYKILESGAIYDMEAGHIAGNPGGGKHAITKDNAKDMQARRWDLARDAYAQGFVEGTPGMTASDPDTEAWRAIGRKTAELLHAATSARGYAELLNAAAKYLGVERESHALTSAGATPQQVLDLVGQIADIVRLAAGRDPVIDVAATDG